MATRHDPTPAVAYWWRVGSRVASCRRFAPMPCWFRTTSSSVAVRRRHPGVRHRERVLLAAVEQRALDRRAGRIRRDSVLAPSRWSSPREPSPQVPSHVVEALDAVPLHDRSDGDAAVVEEAGLARRERREDDRCSTIRKLIRRVEVNEPMCERPARRETSSTPGSCRLRLQVTDGVDAWLRAHQSIACRHEHLPAFLPLHAYIST